MSFETLGANYQIALVKFIEAALEDGLSVKREPKTQAELLDEIKHPHNLLKSRYAKAVKRHAGNYERSTDSQVLGESTQNIAGLAKAVLDTYGELKQFSDEHKRAQQDGGLDLMETGSSSDTSSTPGSPMCLTR